MKSDKYKLRLFGWFRIQILLHILAWIILLGLPIYFIRRWHIQKDFAWFYYVNMAINGCIFYVNFLFLVPRYFFQTKKLKYYLSALILVVTFYFVSDFSNRLIFRYESESAPAAQANQSLADGSNSRRNPPVDRHRGRPPMRQMHFFSYTFNSLMLVFFSLGLRVIERNARIEKRQKELEKEKLNSELAFLKNQISPHFFFNTLNNIYSLISINAEDSQNAVLKLSKLMRYLLYESEQGTSLLGKEIEFMNNYIDLMRLRMNEKVDLRVEFPSDYENISISPLLFIPFVENAFKFGISYREKSFIHIALHMKGQTLVFQCTNSLVRAGEEKQDSHSGIGLENVKKRLSLLYPGKHVLNLDTSKGVFDVTLTINLKNS